MSTLTSTGAAHRAAARLTARSATRRGAVAAEILDWIEDQADEGRAAQAVLAASILTNNMNRMLVIAGEVYEELPASSSVSGDGTVTEIVALTQAEYGQLTPEPTTLYIITEE